MTQVGQDSLGARQTLKVGNREYGYYSLARAAEEYGDISHKSKSSSCRRNSAQNARRKFYEVLVFMGIFNINILLFRMS